MTTQENIEQEAEFLTNKRYLGEGYFGGKARMEGGNVVGIKLFDHQATKQGYINQLKKDGFGKTT